MSNIINASSQLTSETITWKGRVQAVGGNFEWNSIAIANILSRQLRSKSYYNKIIYLMPYLGAGVVSSIIPLIDRNNVGSPTNVNFVNADFTQSTGLKGNASNKRLAMPFKAGSLGTTNNGGVGFWSINVSVAAGTQYALGATDTGFTGPTYGMRFGNSAADINCEFYWGGNSARITLSELRSNSHYYGNRSSSTSRVFYKNGVSVGTNTTSDTATTANDLVFASYALNAGSGGFLVFWGGSKGVEYYTDGTMTSDEVYDFHQTINSYLMGPTGRA